jgi:hypothetical protein
MDKVELKGCLRSQSLITIGTKKSQPSTFQTSLQSQQLPLINFQEELMIISDLNHIESVESSQIIGGHYKRGKYRDKDRDKDRYKDRYKGKYKYKYYDC